MAMPSTNRVVRAATGVDVGQAQCDDLTVTGRVHNGRLVLDQALRGDSLTV